MNDITIELTPDLSDYLSAMAAKNDMTPEQIVVQIIESEMKVVESKTGKVKAKINLADFQNTKHLGALEQGKEARELFKINELDERIGRAFLVHVPDDMPTMTFKFFTGLFDQSVMLLGPTVFRARYVFDADVGNLQLIDRYTRMLWERVKDVELFRVTSGFEGEHDVRYTVWLKIRDEVSLSVTDETAVGDYTSRNDVMEYVAGRDGRIVEDVIA